MNTAQYDAISGALVAIVRPQVTTPPPSGVVFVHYDEKKVQPQWGTKLTDFQAAAQIAGAIDV